MSALDSELYWKAKLAAWVHDPAEKALILMRTPHGHEGGTVAKLRETLGLDGLPPAILDAVKKADHWASAADRPQFPLVEGQGRYQSWATVSFAREPRLRHPLSGEEYDLGRLELPTEAIEAVSFDVLASLLTGVSDPKMRFLKLWGLGSDAGSGPPELGHLWRVLPADTRVPDHSIWDHLRVTSAFAGIFAIGETPAILSVSIGPVQAFIEQARSTSDLWAGSHLLATLAWEGMKCLAERVGPDAILSPDLSESPAARRWLHDYQLVDEDLWHRWGLHRGSDANPAFVASLPNRFLALVPASMCKEIAEELEEAIRDRARGLASSAWEAACDAAGMPVSDHARQQLEAQLCGFPEVQFAAAPFSLIQDQKEGLDVAKLDQATRTLAGEGAGFLHSEGWKVLSKEIQVDGARFYKPNPGVLYPAVFELAERALAGVKRTREFAALTQRGYRCTLCGEREPLVDDPQDLNHHEIGEGSSWGLIQQKRPSWAKTGERLCALCMTKRVWGHLFSKEVSLQNEGERDVRRYVVSTHAMALSAGLEDLADHGDALTALLDDVYPDWHNERTALPRRLVTGDTLPVSVRALPAVLDAIDEGQQEDEQRGAGAGANLRRSVARLLGQKNLEAYYALIQLDGDEMGKWFSGEMRPKYGDLWHSKIASGLKSQPALGGPELQQYLESPAPASPSYHAALSRTLSDLATSVFPRVIEEAFLGKVLYAGGDDLLAMASVDEVLDLMALLRCAYSGFVPPSELGLEQRLTDSGLKLGGGHLLFRRGGGRGQLHRTMGPRATMSMGIVIAHHKTPLQAALRELRARERAAKRNRRDSFSIALMKRSGGTEHFTAKWNLGPTRAGPPPGLSAVVVLSQLRRALTNDLSRRASYSIIDWLTALGTQDVRDADMLASSMAWLFDRKRIRDGDDRRAEGETKAILHALARDIANLAVGETSGDAEPRSIHYIVGLLRCAEFLARPERSGPEPTGVAS